MKVLYNYTNRGKTLTKRGELIAYVEHKPGYKGERQAHCQMEGNERTRVYRYPVSRLIFEETR